MRLTDLQIGKLRSPETGQKTYFDDALPGFGVRVSQGGSKSFVVMYGKSRKLKTLGRYPNITLKDARVVAKRLQSDLSLQTPATDQDILPIDYNQARERFLIETTGRTKSSTAKAYRWLLERHFQLDKKLLEVSRNDLMSVLEALVQTPSERQHAYVAIRTMMNWCVRHGYLEHSPVPVLKFASNARERVLSDLELRAVWNRTKEVGYPFGTIVQLLILTGQRRGEIAGLRRSWVNSDVVTFPAGFAKNKREHRLPLSSLAQAVIDEIDIETDLLFPSRLDEEKPLNGWSKCKRHFDKTLQLAPYTLHDLRRTYSSKLAELGVPIYVTEKLLNHVSGTISGVAAVYNRHSYWEEMKQACNQHDRFLSNLFAA